MVLFVLHYISNLLIFALGLQAPGIVSPPASNYHSFDDGPNPQSTYFQGVSHVFNYLCHYYLE